MKKVVFDEQIEIKLHNNREEGLYTCLSNIIERDKEYLNNNTFGEDTHRLIERYDMTEADGILTSMFFLDMIDKPFNVSDISFYKEHGLYKY